MGSGAVASNVPQNPYTQQSAGNAFNAVNNFSAMPNYAQGANNAFTGGIYGSTLGANTNYDPTSLMTAGNTISSLAAPLEGAGMATFLQGADPMKSQFNYYKGQLDDSINSSLAQRGLSMDPYGAAVQAQGDAAFANQWAMNRDQAMQGALSGFTGATGGAAGALGQGANLAAEAPAFQSSMLGQLLAALNQNYTQPQMGVQNQLGYMGAANAQNQTAVNSAAQASQANAMNSPMAFLGSLMGGSGSMMSGAAKLLPLLAL